MSTPGPRRAAALARSLAAASLGLLCLAAVSSAIAPTHAAATTQAAQARSWSLTTPKARACTIVGTPRRDKLFGTAGRDVICGRGGDDELIGLGNDDVLIGGPGADTLDGGYGRDVLTGEDGRDRLDGGPGPDRLVGGSSPDVALGGFGADRLLGGRGNDDLTGGPHKDVIDGGPGTNWCSTDEVDIATQCAYDLAPPTADSLTLSSDRVDVTNSDRRVTFRVHVTDDTGTDFVAVQPSADTPWFPSASARLVSGTVRDGWWEGTLTFHRWSRPARFTPVVEVWDRISRRTLVELVEPYVDVFDESPDLNVPEVSVLGPSLDETFDVRSSGVDIQVTLHITDEVSGVDADAINMLLWAPRVNGAQTQGFGGSLRLQSGTIHDGTWAGRFEIPRNAIGGSWQLAVYVNDRASRGARPARAVYWGPREYAYQQWSNPAEGHQRPFPHGMGSVTVLGRDRTDFSAPVISGVKFSVESIDTLDGAKLVQVRAHATDVGSGTKGVSVYLIAGDSTWPQLGAPSVSLELTSGSGADGMWTGAITVPRGYPPGTYYAWVPTWDRDNNEVQYLSGAHPGAGYYRNVLDTAATVTIGGADNLP